MSAMEFTDDPKVGELQFVRSGELLEKSENISDCCGDCADPGTGADTCTCED